MNPRRLLSLLLALPLVVVVAAHCGVSTVPPGDGGESSQDSGAADGENGVPLADFGGGDAGPGNDEGPSPDDPRPPESPLDRKVADGRPLEQRPEVLPTGRFGSFCIATAADPLGECKPGTFCWINPKTKRGICTRKCTDNDDCRGGPAPATCMLKADKGLACGFPCRARSDLCPPGLNCFIAGGFCAPPAFFGSRTYGQPCDLSGGDPATRCDNDLTCWRSFETDKGFCTAACQNDTDCVGGPRPAACVIKDKGGSWCAFPCKKAGDPCPKGLICDPGAGYCFSAEHFGAASFGEPCRQGAQDARLRCAMGNSCFSNPATREGFCTRSCKDSSDCTVGTHGASCIIKSGGAMACGHFCDKPGDPRCPAGLTCEPRWGYCFNKLHFGTAGVGEACSTLGVKPSDRCGLGADCWYSTLSGKGHCSRVCGKDADCGGGGNVTCSVPFSGGRACGTACKKVGDPCPKGMVCDPIQQLCSNPGNHGTVGYGGVCATGSKDPTSWCKLGMGCWTDGGRSEGFCTRRCTTDADCSGGIQAAQCNLGSSGGKFCAFPCTRTGDACPAGLTCDPKLGHCSVNSGP